MMDQLCNIEMSWQTVSDAVSDIVVYRSEDPRFTAQYNTDINNKAGITLVPPQHVINECVSENLDDITGTQQGIQQCTAKISCRYPSRDVIEAIDILCSARHAEVFSKFGEYISTSDGCRVDEELGCDRRLYMLQTHFEPTTDACLIKFVSLELKSELWLHSIHITMASPALDTAPDLLSIMSQLGALPNLALLTSQLGKLPDIGQTLSAVGGANIDMRRVRNMLEEMGRPVTPAANSLLQAMEAKQQDRQTACQLQVNSAIMMHTLNSLHLTDKSRPANSSLPANQNPPSTSTGSSVTSTGSSVTNDVIIKLLAQLTATQDRFQFRVLNELQQMEQRLSDVIVTRLGQLEQRVSGLEQQLSGREMGHVDIDQLSASKVGLVNEVNNIACNCGEQQQKCDVIT